MVAERIEIQLIPAPDDAAPNSAEYQAELDGFYKILRSRGVVPQRVLETLEAAVGPGETAMWLGQFVIVAKTATPIVAIIGPALGTVIGVWLHNRYGRKVRMKIGDIEVEAQTMDEVRELLHIIEEHQRNHNKLIHEP